MFRSAATKIAHNSTLPALGGNKDLRPLQDLITSEKVVLQSLQRLSADVHKSGECLRHWGAGEGDDLQDTLNASATLIGHFAAAISQLATHQISIRENMKALRTREEELDDLKRRRRAVAAKADSAEKKLAKMGTEHKNLQQQTELLNNLREQIRTMDWDILTDEARLGDFKRTASKEWMIIKFGSILEAAEKSTIVGELGKLVIEEIPQSKTDPGQARSFYTGHEKTEKLMAEANRCISEVHFDPQNVGPTSALKSPNLDGGRNIDGLPSGGNLNSSSYLQDTTSSMPAPGGGADEFGGLGSSRAYGTMPMPGGGSSFMGDDGSRLPSGTGEGNVSSFASPSSPAASRFGGGQFSTFPARKGSLPPGGGLPPQSPQSQDFNFQSSLDDGPGSTFASEVADALAYAEHGDGQPGQGRGPVGHDPRMGPGGLPRGAAPPTSEPNPWEQVPSTHVREPNHSSHGDDTELAYASPPQEHTNLPPHSVNHPAHVHFGAEPQIPSHGRSASMAPSIPPPPQEYEDDESARQAAAAREVAREMDMLTFNPPPGPPPAHREPSPLIPPAPPFAYQQGLPQGYDGSIPHASEGAPLGSPKPELRGPSNLAVEPPTTQNQSSAPPSPQAEHRPRPSVTLNVHSPSPSHSYMSGGGGSTYGTPPEMPAAMPPRTGSPASPSVLTTGARTISASAFKRPGMRSASNSQVSSGSMDMAGSGRPLPDVSPLSVRKRVPGSPYMGPRDIPPEPQGPSGTRKSSESMKTGEAAPPYSEFAGNGHEHEAEDLR